MMGMSTCMDPRNHQIIQNLIDLMNYLRIIYISIQSGESPSSSKNEEELLLTISFKYTFCPKIIMGRMNKNISFINVSIT